MEPSKAYIATPRRTREIMDRHDIKMKKSLGQNFLVEPNILRKMIDTAQITPETTVIEIGPGIGALTEFLALHAKEVTAFEIDQRFIQILAETLNPYDNVTIIHQDILSVDFDDGAYQALREADDLVVVANLPYYITTPIILSLIQSRLPFQRLIMMMQKEVAQRFTAAVGTKSYNSLSVAIQNQMEAEISFIVPKNVFIPKPNVDSAVLTLTRRNTPIVTVQDEADFEQFVQACFKQRRKTLWNNLKSYLGDAKLENLEGVFNQTGIDPKRRAESLTIPEFHQLYLAATDNL